MNRESLRKRREWSAVYYDNRASVILELLEKVKPREKLIGAEIGVWRGDLISLLLNREPRIRKMYGVDPYIVYMCEGRIARGWGQDRWDGTYKKVVKGMEIFGDRFELVRERSDAGAKLLPKLDFVELDGDRVYEQAVRDISIYEKKVAKGGLLCGHGYCGIQRYIEGVKDAADWYAKEYGRELKVSEKAWMWWWYVS
jgi:hypothetical protein